MLLIGLGSQVAILWEAFHSDEESQYVDRPKANAFVRKSSSGTETFERETSSAADPFAQAEQNRRQREAAASRAGTGTETGPE